MRRVRRINQGPYGLLILVRNVIMRKFIPLCLSATLLVSTLGFLSGAGANAQTAGLVSSILTRMEKNKRSLKSLRANISMTKYNSQLHDSDTYQGVVMYIPGAGGNASSSVRLEWTRPKRSEEHTSELQSHS